MPRLLALSNLRTVALNLIRRLGFRFIPDGWRVLAAQPDRGLSLPLHPMKAISENRKALPGWINSLF
ncbi:MAG: hypothetical protein ACP5R2_11565 [Anaerolineae bacterium]